MTTQDINYFKQTVDRTSDRLQSLCDQWSREISENEKNMAEEIVQKIHSVIGKSQLLRSSKFKQFRGFLFDAGDSTIGKPVHLDDIRGFWETICLQIEEVERTFKELEELKKNNYVQHNSVTVPDGVCSKKTVVKKPAAHPVKKPIVASSNLKNFISAQRERKKLDNLGDEIHIAGSIPSNGHV